jgi:hypothetical protein
VDEMMEQAYYTEAMSRSVCISINHLMRVCFIAVTAGHDEDLLRFVLGKDFTKSSEPGAW